MPGSTLMYGSALRIDALKPTFLRRVAILAAAIPLPRELKTPPVTKMYLVGLDDIKVLRFWTKL